MSVILFSAAELADVAVAATTGPIEFADRMVLASMAADLAIYSRANVAAYNASYSAYPEQSVKASDIFDAAVAKDSAKLEKHRDHGAGVVSLFGYNAISQGGRDYFEEMPEAREATIRVITKLLECTRAKKAVAETELAPKSKAEPLTRAETIKRIKTALKKRSGKTWSVTGGRGTAWGWLRIDAPPRRRKYNWDGTGEGEYSSAEDRAELAKLLNVADIHPQGLSVPSGSHYWEEYVDRAEGREPTKRGEIYWD